MLRTDIAKAHIKNYADSIRKSVNEKGITTLYGEPLDLSDPDSLLVVAVLLAEQNAREKTAKEYDLLLGLPHKN